ncbi:MAG TPA: MFS transporter [Verrucomicrobiae bacterium]|jgi:ACS family D-galactonate transporter-like MFS transporter|nr:MFS transporter [Verrucomicrobiae bacterium]
MLPIDQKPTCVRYRVLAMLFVMVVINYLDRSNLSVAATSLDNDLKLDSFHTGLLLSAFGWAYAAWQIPGGWLVDRVQPRVLYALICGLWSVATLLQGFVGTFIFLFSLRILVGTFEAPAYPLLNRLVTIWFPANERAGAIGCYTSGQYVGLAFLTPVLLLAQKCLGWQSVFIFTGVAGLIWAGIWYWLYRRPAESPAINPAEMQFIQAGGGLGDSSANPVSSAPEKIQWADLGLVLSRRKLWGIYIGQFAVNATLWFFLTWFPTYLIKYRHIDFIRVGYYASLPFFAAFCGVIASGLLSDFLLRRGWSVTTARKVPVISGLLLCTSIVGANYVSHPVFIILFLAIAGFGNGFSSIAWVFVAELAPKQLIGLTGGMFNFFGNCAAIVVPLVIGLLVRENNFAPGMVFVAVLALIGALSYVFMVGRVERIK